MAAAGRDVKPDQVGFPCGYLNMAIGKPTSHANTNNTTTETVAYLCLKGRPAPCYPHSHMLHGSYCGCVGGCGGGACTKVDELLWGSQVSDQTISAQSKNNTETHKHTQDTTYLLALGFSSGVKVIDMGVSSSAGGHMLAWVRLEVVYCATSAGDRVGRGGGILACNPQPCSG